MDARGHRNAALAAQVPSRQAANDSALMPPPPSRRPRDAGAPSSSTSTSLPLPLTLSEGAYTEGLAHIIERDFFPDLPRLQQQLRWLQALETRDPEAIAEARAALSHSVRRVDRLVSAADPTPRRGPGASAAAPTPSSNEWGGAGSRAALNSGATPLHDGVGGTAAAAGLRRHPSASSSSSSSASSSAAAAAAMRDGDDDDDGASLVSWSAEAEGREGPSFPKRRRGAGAGALPPAPDPAEGDGGGHQSSASSTSSADPFARLPLDAFQTAFTSEDAASFAENFAKVSEERARRHWWAHLPVDDKRRLLMRADGHARRALPLLLLQGAATAATAAAASAADVRLLGDQAAPARGALSDASTSAAQGVAQASAPQSWPHRPRNSLFFEPPRLENATSFPPTGAAAAAQAAQAGSRPALPLLAGRHPAHSTVATPSTAIATTTGGGNDSDGALLVSVVHRRPDGGVAVPREIRHAGTRLRPADLQEAMNAATPDLRTPSGASVRGGPALPAAVAAGLGAAGQHGRGGNDGYEVVFTPVVLVGGSSSSAQPDVITWGEVSGTPLILDPDVAQAQAQAQIDALDDTEALTAALALESPFVSRAAAAASAASAGPAGAIPPVPGATGPFHIAPPPSREDVRDQMLEKAAEARRARAARAGVSTTTTTSVGSSAGAASVVSAAPTPLPGRTPAGLTPGATALTKAHLRHAIAEARSGLIGTAPGGGGALAGAGAGAGGGGTTARRTPLFAASATPSALLPAAAHTSGSVVGGRGSGGSVVSAASRSSSVASASSSSSALTAALRGMTPAGRRLAAQVAAQVARESGVASAAGDLAGTMSSGRKRGR
jgi:hypothetical protein